MVKGFYVTKNHKAMINVPPEYFETESCLYKLSYGDRYAIIKAKTLAGSIFLFEKGYAAFIAAGGGTGKDQGGKGQKEWDGTNSYYFKFYKFIHSHPNIPFKVDVLLETNNAYLLLKTEQQWLNKTISDKKCLNSNVTAYIPKYSPKTASYGWISKRNVADFRRFLST